MLLRLLRGFLKKRPYNWIAVVVLLLGSIYLFSGLLEEKSTSPPPIKSFSQLETRLGENKTGDLHIDKLTYDPNTQTMSVKEQELDPYKIAIPGNGLEDEGLGRVLKIARENKIPVSSLPLDLGQETALGSFLRILPTLLVIMIIAFFLYQMGGMKGFKAHEAESSTVGFEDVAGCNEAIEELQDVRLFLSDPQLYNKLGARAPKGVLLHGPPGTGKTLLAKAVANEAGIPFYSSTGSEFVEMYAGLGAKRVRQLFSQAKKTAPSIIFIDELDAVGGKRGMGGGDGGTREADQTLIQILKEMDGFEVGEHPVIIMGATNRLETLDQALTRPGRFDRHIAIDPPDKHGRFEILKVHSKGKPMDASVDLWKIAIQTSGMSGADLALLLNEAALLAARRRGDKVEEKDLDDAFFRIVAGAKKQHRALSDEEREIVAYHESGHALIGERLRRTDKVHKISIIPRGRSGGQTMYVSDEDVFLHSEDALKDRLVALLGGRAAEELVFNQITSGAQDDLTRATDLAMKMIAHLGMGKALGLRVQIDEHPLPNELATDVDREVKALLDEQYARAKKIISEDMESLKRVTIALLEEETIDRDRFLALLAEVEQAQKDKPKSPRRQTKTRTQSPRKKQ